ncbi:G-protein coupled receptor moody-like [Lingula anatina]|uniref:G-protein coupled receptor moody-like n=1 Tax=Lingula anatina TaxID=7574 RepID=A0A1S3IJF1_LINAN|nr:G-protein coupled receptor moody-like [Lingula anatina]|eukprot:XP_013398370.1 G-protein coupled receptor moody-like [Lingula anatina]
MMDTTFVEIAMNKTLEELNTSIPNGAEDAVRSQVLWGVVGIIILLLGLSTNVFVIFAIVHSKQMRASPTYILIVNLSINNGPVHSLFLAFDCYGWFTGKWNLGEPFCAFIGCATFLVLASSGLCLMCITVQRYIYIVWFVKHITLCNPTTEKIVYVVCSITCYVLPLLILLPVLTGTVGKAGFDPYRQRCTILQSESAEFRNTFLVVFICFPNFSMIYCFTHISVSVFLNRRRMININQAVRHQAQKMRQNTKIAQMFGICYLSFVVAITPCFIVNVLQVDGALNSFYTEGTYVLIYSSSIVNPIVYALMNQTFRDAYKAMNLCRCFSVNRVAPVPLDTQRGSMPLSSVYVPQHA